MHNLKKRFLACFLACLSVILLSSAQIWADTNVGGIINNDTTWTSGNSPYNLTSDVQVAYGATLSIEPGVLVEGHHVAIQVWGLLDAVGTDTQKIVFNNVKIKPGINKPDEPFLINIKFSKINGGSLYSPTGYGIYGSLNLSDSKLNNIPEIHLWYPTSDCYIERNIFTNTNEISIVTNTANVYIINNIFYKNMPCVVKVWANYYAQIIVENNSFLSTDRIALQLPLGYHPASMTAINNYWNTTDTSVIDNMIYDKNDDLACDDYINYLPILNSPHIDTPLAVISITPSEHMTNDVPVNSSINAIFSEAMDSTTINAATFLMSEGVMGSVTYDPTTNIAIFIPSSALQHNKIYTMTITTEAKSLMGKSLSSIYTWAFTTEDTEYYVLNFSTIGSGIVTSNPSGINCGLDCSETFDKDTIVTLTATADSGYIFSAWSGCDSISGNTCTVAMNGNKNVTANFSQNCDRSLIININPPGSGTVTKNPDKANYCPNEQVTLTASQNSDYTFNLWDGVDSSNGTTASITMNANRTVTVNFNQQTSNEPDISVDPVTQVFANIPVGDSSMPQTLTISNTGSGNLVIGTLSITGHDASQFIKQNDTCSGQTVTPSANCTVNVIFSPTSTGSFDSILNIPSNDLDEPNVTVNLKGGSGADITGSWISLFQKCNRANCKINGKFNVQNIGNRDALSSLVRFYLSDDGVYYEAYRFLKEAKTGTLKVGKSKSISLSYSLPSGISATDKYIIAVVDPDNTVMEANESNNIFIYGPILRANLTGMWTLLTQQCKGEKCKIRGAFNIQNTGGQDATSCFVRFYLSDDNVYDAGDTFLKQISTGTLKVGKSKKMNLSYSLLSGISATDKYIIAVIDEDNSVLEANEDDNNIAYGPIP
ncbi:MAG: CARDB domain-containing protein [Thermodesulfovibrionales bacterium]